MVALTLAAPPASAAGGRDVTADVLANRDVTLTGDRVVTVPTGTTTYAGVFRGEGTLTVRGSGTLILTRDSDFTLPASRQRKRVTTQGGNHPYTTVADPDPPAITVEPGATLQYGTGGGTVRGAVTNDGVVAGGLTVTGDYTQHAMGELVLRDGPLKVAGRVRLAGGLDLSDAGSRPGREITVLDHGGRTKTEGTFEGLREGAKLKRDDTTYRISYRGGDGNDVVLTAVTASASAKARTASPSDAADDPRTTNTASDGPLSWWPQYALGVALAAGLMVSGKYCVGAIAAKGGADGTRPGDDGTGPPFH